MRGKGRKIRGTIFMTAASIFSPAIQGVTAVIPVPDQSGMTGKLNLARPLPGFLHRQQR
jgi:hypothetical protein